MRFFSILLLSLLLHVTMLGAQGFSPFLEKEIEIYKALNDQNLTEEQTNALIDKESLFYNQALLDALVSKQSYLDNTTLYDKEIYTLKKRIQVNKRLHNDTAVLRDEVRLSSYVLVQTLNRTLRKILAGLDNIKTLTQLDSHISSSLQSYQQNIQKIAQKDFSKYYVQEPTSKIEKDLNENILEFEALQAISGDIVTYIYKFKGKMYRLNKYSKFHLIGLVVYLESFSVIHSVNEMIEPYGLNIVKILMIVFVVLIIFFIRRVFVLSLQYLLQKIDLFKAYTQIILSKLEKTIDALFIVINIHMVTYIYNDFVSVEILSKFFNIIYVVFATYIIYTIINTVAKIKLNSFDVTKLNVKTDLINVGIKIINTVIFILGLLFALYFAGVNLTAVLSGLGIGGFALAFAAKDTISNFFGTISVLVSDVFSQGDWIEIDGNEGTVVEIGLRVTTIRTFDNALISIPNGTFASKEVKNWNKRKVGRRIKMSIGVTYSSKVEDLERAVKQIREMLIQHPDIAKIDSKYEYHGDYGAKLVSKNDLEGVKTTLLVYLDEFSDSSINILVYCFSQSVVWEEWLKTKQDVMEKIMKILEANSLEFAFPSLSIYREN